MTRQDMIEIGYIPTFKNISMLLKHFTPETLAVPKKTKDLCLTVRKSGAICFTVPALEALKLKKGSKISLAQDEASKEWYLLENPKGFELRSLGQQIGFSSVQLVNLLWTNSKPDQKSIHLVISETPIVYDKQPMYLLTISKK